MSASRYNLYWSSNSAALLCAATAFLVASTATAKAVTLVASSFSKNAWQVISCFSGGGGWNVSFPTTPSTGLESVMVLSLMLSTVVPWGMWTCRISTTRPCLSTFGSPSDTSMPSIISLVSATVIVFAASLTDCSTDLASLRFWAASAVSFFAAQ